MRKLLIEQYHFKLLLNSKKSFSVTKKVRKLINVQLQQYNFKIENIIFSNKTSEETNVSMANNNNIILKLNKTKKTFISVTNQVTRDKTNRTLNYNQV